MVLPPKLLSVLLLCLLLGSRVEAQKQANIWYIGKYGLDFNHTPPRLLDDGAMVSSEARAIMSDAEGRLLFYTNGVDVWNRNHAVMANGTGLAGHISSRQGALIVPQPGSRTRYFVFTTDAMEFDFAKGFSYSVVDMARQGGLGEVVQKNVLLHPLGEENIAATGSCDCPGQSRFWVAADRHDRPGILYAYLVDGQGVHAQTVASLLPGVSNISFLKFSPAGDKIAFTGVGAPNRQIIGIADFDQATGVATDLKLITTTTVPPAENSLNYDFHRAIEFSPDGKLLYFTSWGQVRLVQYDLSQPSADRIANSAIVLADLQNFPVNSFHAPQLGPDGRLYLTISGNPPLGGLATLEHPNQRGVAATLRTAAVPEVGSLVLPNFVSSLLYRNDTLSLNLEAGPDRQVCSTAPATLGSSGSPALRYRWSPGAFLSDSTSPNPVFRHPGPVERETTLTYVLSASDGPCTRRDTVRVTVHPLPAAQPAGPRSVCPGVEGVPYQADALPGHTYRWRVEGGSITGGQGTAAITVSWGPTNPGAWVEVVAVSPQGCEGLPARLPVRINVELDTETPQGPDSVCLNKRQGSVYQVTHTPGSVYTWAAAGGTVASGQGSARVTVDWAGEGTHRLWLQEQSTTRDTVCFGTSDTLAVTVYRDRTALRLHHVSVSLADERVVEAHWSGSDPARLTGPLLVYRRAQGDGNWQQATALPRGSTSHADGGLQTDEEIYAYRVETRNGCEEPVGTGTHATVRLTGGPGEAAGLIGLSWSPYEGWPEGVARYEVWRKLDGEEELRLVGQADGGTLHLGGASSLDGFDHRFRVRAVARGTGLASWSNELELTFAHELTVPNIFTPNGDGYNDTFTVPLLELYPDNRLTFYSRWGQQVYWAEGYRNQWTARDLAEGTYYYSLLLRRTGKLLKGWVEVVR